MSLNGVKITVEGEDERKGIYSYDDALKIIGFGRVQIEIIIAGFLILINQLNETMGISYIVLSAQCDMKFTDNDKGLLSSSIFLGISASSFVWGSLAGTQGRRFVILLSLLGSTIFTTLSALSISFSMLVTCRFFTGFFLAGYSGTIYAYMGEFCIPKHRAIIISWASLSVGIGLIFLPLSMWIMSHNWSINLYDGYQFRPWRLLLLVFMVPGIVGGFWLYRFPESPKYLLNKNQHKEVLDIFEWMYRMNKKEIDALNIKSLKSEINESKQKQEKCLKTFLIMIGEQTLPLLRKPFIFVFFATCFLQFGIFWAAGGLSICFPDIFNKIASVQNRNSSNSSLLLCDILSIKGDTHIENDTLIKSCDNLIDSKVFTESLLFGIAFTFTYTIISVFMKAKRRRFIITSTLLASSISGYFLIYTSSHYLIISFFCSFIMLSGINSSIINGAVCDFFPTHLRSMVVSITMLCGRFGTVISSNLIDHLLERHCEITFQMCATITLTCFVLSFVLPT